MLKKDIKIIFFYLTSSFCNEKLEKNNYFQLLLKFSSIKSWESCNNFTQAEILLYAITKLDTIRYIFKKVRARRLR
jgi:hypothetical protein